MTSFMKTILLLLHLHVNCFDVRFFSTVLIGVSFSSNLFQFYMFLFFLCIYTEDCFTVKGAAKFCFVYYSYVVIILFSRDLYKSAFFTYSFRKPGFCLSVFYVFFWFVLCFEFDVISKD